jgi:hypothetical protein
MSRGKIGTVLIDKLIEMSKGTHTEIDGKWYVAKPLPFYSWRDTAKTRLVWAWKILTGRAIAVHYKQDEDEEP